jgi:hypothetical protein
MEGRYYIEDTETGEVYSQTLDDFAKEALVNGGVTILLSGAGYVGGRMSMGSRQSRSVNPERSSGPKSVTPTTKQLDKFQKQLQEHGRKSVERSQRKIQRRLDEHVEKLDQIKKDGGHASSVEREIRNFERELEAIKQTLGDGS